CQDGERRLQFRRAQDYCDHWGIVWRRTLCHVRQGLRSAICFCVADREICGHGRRRRRQHAGRNQNSSTGARCKQLTEVERKELYESTKRTYDEQADPRYGAARLWIDKIIDPMETRAAITQALEAAALNPDVAEFKVGVLQT